MKTGTSLEQKLQPLAILVALGLSSGCAQILGIDELPPPEDTVDGAPFDGAPAGADASVPISDALPADGIGADASIEMFDVEAEMFSDNQSIERTHHWEARTDVSGFFGTHYMESLPDNMRNCQSNVTSCGAVMTYPFTLSVAGSYYLHMHINTEGPGDDSVNWSIDDPDSANPSSDNDGNHNVWKWRSPGRMHDLMPGEHTLRIFMREDGFKIDRIIINREPDPNLPVAPGS